VKYQRFAFQSIAERMLDMKDNNRISRLMMLQGIQHWGQSQAQRDEAITNYVKAAGFDPSDPEADKWLSEVILSMPRGKYEIEVDHLTAALAKAQLKSEATRSDTAAPQVDPSA
jgi:hypothetical protein